MLRRCAQIVSEGDNVTELNVLVSGEVAVAEGGMNMIAALGQYNMVRDAAGVREHGALEAPPCSHAGPCRVPTKLE